MINEAAHACNLGFLCENSQHAQKILRNLKTSKLKLTNR